MATRVPRAPHGPAEPTINKGVRFSLAEWSVVHSLQRILGLSFTGLVKLAFRELAASHGLKWPANESEPTEKAS